MSSTDPAPSRQRRVRIFHIIRTAHLERERQMPPATVLYQSTRYDFDPSLAGGLDLRQQGLLGLIRTMLVEHWDAVEVNEPLLRSGLIRTSAALAALRLGDAVRRRRTPVVTYAIENLDPFAAPPSRRLRSRIRYGLDRVLSKRVARRIDRIAFGTDGAQELYQSSRGKSLQSAERTVVQALPAPCTCEQPAQRPSNQVIYLGALHERKGIRELMAAWPSVVARQPAARLKIVGKGALEAEVREFVSQYPSAELIIDPPRDQIHLHLWESSVLVLLSKRTPSWREQVGLPLVEGLAHGCAVITTKESGIAPWLAEHGHVTLDHTDVKSVTSAVVRSLDESRSAESVLADLPDRDGRLAADEWMFAFEEQEIQVPHPEVSPTAGGSTPSLTVLQSFPQPRPTTNPYLIMLARALREEPGVSVLNFSWRTALLGKYDVFHVHWPEIMVAGRTSLKKAARHALFVVLLVRLRVTRRPIVRTMHNLELPRDISKVEIRLLNAINRQTTVRVRLNSSTPLPPEHQFDTIVLGHYRDWFEAIEPSAMIPGRICYFGLVRRYKGVDQLIRAFTSTSRSDLSLSVAGKPSTEELADSLTALAGEDGRIGLKLEYISDKDLVHEVTSAELVVLPYREMHNSSGVLTALSLGRPVLVPDNEVNRLMSAEVGAGWIFTYGDDLDGEDLIRTIDQVRRAERPVAPDLSRRDWDQVGREHVSAYRRAIKLRARN